MNFTAGEITLLLASYALGCCCAGYYLVRFRSGQDIREHGSGSAGATNVARELGVAGFALTFVVDLAKGALAVWSATYFGLEPDKAVLAMLAVVGGHIWPAQLRFHGGKGIATAIGAILVFDYRLALGVFLLSGLLFALSRRLALAGLAAVAVSPVVMAVLGRTRGAIAGMTALAAMILIAHRTNIRRTLGEIRSGSAPKRNQAPGL